MWAGAAASGLLMAVCFPPWEWNNVAWIALVPLLVVLRFADEKQGWKLGLTAGVVFWLMSIYWLTRVTVAGWIGLSLYCAGYVALFAVVAGGWMRRFGVGRAGANLGLMALASLTWAGLEYVRSVLLTGFPWNPFGAAQHGNLALIQLASWGGVYAVSALIVLINAAIALTVLRYIELKGRWTRSPHPELFVGAAVLLVTILHGARILRNEPPASAPLRVALIQTGIPQDEKWDQEKIELIYRRLQELTQGALLAGKPDLIIWPETALPDDVRSSPPSYQVVYDLVTNGVPILVGSMDTAWQDEGKPIFYNSSFLFDPTGTMVQGYDKRHLVIFGEYIPWNGLVSFINALTPIQESFSPGSTSTVFRLEQPDCAFSVLICFEDAVAKLGRESVRNGARLLINQTNDAWFDPSSASLQHMIQSIFRCVENRVPAVRVANTGVSCTIDAKGRITSILQDEQGHTQVIGFKTVSVEVPLEVRPLTFYTRHGDVFAQSAAGVGLAFLAALGVRRRLARTARRNLEMTHVG